MNRIKDLSPEEMTIYRKLQVARRHGEAVIRYLINHRRHTWETDETVSLANAAHRAEARRARVAFEEFDRVLNDLSV